MASNKPYTHITTQVGKLFVGEIKESSLKVLRVGGEKLGEIENLGDYILIDRYGPTESFAFITHIINSKKIDSSSVGLPNYNINVYILDDEFRRVPVGAVGELYLSGCQIAEGYLNRDEETKKAFLDNPFDKREDYSIMYRTGDMVRVLPDGTLGILGRRDSQVKIRGNRVELGEIEYIIRSIEDIEDVTVQTIKNNDNNELVAYVVASDNFNDDLTVYVKEFVGGCKPDYMVPSYVIELSEIPLTVNGKVDKNALPEVDLESLHADYVAPTTGTERLIVDAFEKVFEQDQVGVYDDFTRLGGDSLSAIKLLSYLEDYNVTAAAASRTGSVCFSTFT